MNDDDDDDDDGDGGGGGGDGPEGTRRRRFADKCTTRFINHTYNMLSYVRTADTHGDEYCTKQQKQRNRETLGNERRGLWNNVDDTKTIHALN